MIFEMVAIATLVACTTGTKQMTSLPDTGSESGRAVVLFRVTVTQDSEPVRAMLSTSSRWKWHYLVNVGPKSQPLDTAGTFPAGQLGAESMDAGWGFLTLPPGVYELAFAAHRTTFAMRGAQRAALGFGQSPAARLEVPADAPLIYVGTFAFTCESATRWWSYEEHQCSELTIHDDEALVRELATTSLLRFGIVRFVPASIH
jgi:hypothetical protein